MSEQARRGEQTARQALPVPAGVHEDVPPAEDLGALVTLHYLLSELRRLHWLWVVTGLLGVAAAAGLAVVAPPPYEATTTVLLSHRAGEDPSRAAVTDARMATSRSVAQRVVDELDLTVTVDDLLKSYTATNATDRVLEISVRARSSSEAVRRAAAVAAEFLRFRGEQAERQRSVVAAEVTARIEQLQRTADDLAERIDAVQDPSTGGAATARQVTEWQDERAEALSSITQLQQRLQDDELQVVAMTSGTHVMDEAAPGTGSRVKAYGVNAVAGLVGGVALGVGLVLLRALLSDRLRRREDVAAALGAPVRLSVQHDRPRRRRRTGRPCGRRDRGHGHVVGHLAGVVEHVGEPPTLAVVALDSLAVSASVVADLACALAADGRRVLLLDLSGTGALARRFRLPATGVHKVRRAAVPAGGLTVASPDAEALLPWSGPGAFPADNADVLHRARTSADVVLALVVLDPAVGAEHVARWCRSAVAVLRTGRTSATRARATGELLRAAGIDLRSAVLMGADATDDSVGTVPLRRQAPEPDAGVVAW